MYTVFDDLDGMYTYLHTDVSMTVIYKSQIFFFDVQVTHASFQSLHIYIQHTKPPVRSFRHVYIEYNMLIDVE